ncbi:MAG: SpoVG family protein [Gracilibacteraceae bacterium]|jgi:stage V sporulation protein G|nr:SpoVG family protein [Gracilibacteraceae bacterium]
MKNQNQSPSQNHPKVEVRIHPISTPRSNLLAYAAVTLSNCFVINGVQILNGKNGIFVAMPSYKDKKGEYRDICFPVTAEFRSILHETVLAEYAQSCEQVAVGQ